MSLARLVITAVTVEGRSKSEVARDYGVSRVWVQKLVHRYQREGPAAFEPRSRRPHTNPRAVDLEVEDQIVRLRKTLTKKGVDAGAETIAAHLQIAGVDAGAGGLDDLADLVPPRVRGPAAAETAPIIVETFCADQPNERWQADITHWRLADGSEVEILNILDDHSRVNLAAKARRITTGPQVVDTFLAAFSRWGIPASVLTDNGAVFTGKQRGEGRVALEVQLGLRGIRLSHSRPYHPQTCGKVERFHQTQKKWLAAQPARHDPGRAATPAGPVRELLQHRPAAPRPGPAHPAQAYAARPKAVPTGPVIPAHYRVRTDKIDTGGSRHACATTAGYTTSASAPAWPAPRSVCSSMTCTSGSSTATPAS